MASNRVGNGIPATDPIELQTRILQYRASLFDPVTKLLEQFTLGAENSAASIIAVDGALYIRLPDKLVCARKEK